MTPAWTVGNAHDESEDQRGWFVGHFMPDADLRRSSDVEVKWGIHPAGDRRAAWTTGDERTALLILVSGRFRLELPEDSHTLARTGDYIMWGGGLDHSWLAEADSVVITVRWPSIRPD
jgi:hypothetical protein